MSHMFHFSAVFYFLSGESEHLAEECICRQRRSSPHYNHKCHLRPSRLYRRVDSLCPLLSSALSCLLGHKQDRPGIAPQRLWILHCKALKKYVSNDVASQHGKIQNENQYTSVRSPTAPKIKRKRLRSVCLPPFSCLRPTYQNKKSSWKHMHH